MSGVFLARVMLSALAAVQGIASCAIDLNRTHATNPLWPGHARFHLVWQRGTSFLAAVIEVLLVWLHAPAVSSRFYLAAVLTGIPMIAFVLAVLVRPLYHGTLHDANGIPPLRVRPGRRVLELDGNALAVGAGLVVLAMAVWLFYSRT